MTEDGFAPEDAPTPEDLRQHLIDTGLTDQEADDFLTSFEQMLKGEGRVLRRPPKMDLISVQATEPVLGVNQGPTVLRTHGPDQCADNVCCIHNPSDHHMLTWPQLWRSDSRLMERTCPHGIGHPDPDDLNVRTTHWAGVHGCDGCCQPPKEQT